MKRHDGYQEGDQAVVTWCVGHLVTMSYPEAYDEKYKKWSLETLPFLPQEFKYEIIPSVSKQFETVKVLLNRPDVETIYVCTDSGREGEYIYRLVEQMAGVKGKKRLRVWIDSQTEEEIQRGIREAKDLSEYDNLSSAAYLVSYLGIFIANWKLRKETKSNPAVIIVGTLLMVFILAAFIISILPR